MADEKNDNKGGGGGDDAAKAAAAAVAAANAASAKVVELEKQLAEEKAARGEAEAQVDQLMNVAPANTEELEAKLTAAEQKLERLEVDSSSTKAELRKARIDTARAEIERDYPALAGRSDLLPDEEPEAMKNRADILATFTDEQIKNSRGNLEADIAKEYGFPLGSSARVRRDPEKVKERAEAVKGGDADKVAEDIVKNNSVAIFE